MMMGFGCNAAGVVATRIIDSPRERLIAIITNNFALCNGRWPTQILIASLFIGGLVPRLSGGLHFGAVGGGRCHAGRCDQLCGFVGAVAHVLKGEASTFSLELPPYRPPRVWQTIYTSVIDRTLMCCGAPSSLPLPAGAVIWLSANICSSAA
jgi:ferrous iron transport protein B